MDMEGFRRAFAVSDDGVVVGKVSIGFEVSFLRLARAATSGRAGGGRELKVEVHMAWRVHGGHVSAMWWFGKDNMSLHGDQRWH